MNTFTVQKTIKSSAKKVFEAFSKASVISKWFTTNHTHTFKAGGKYKNGDKDEGRYIEIKKDKLIRFTWENRDHCPGTEVCIKLYKNGKNNTTITLTHSKLETEKHLNDMKMGWTWALTCLKSFLETGESITFESWHRKKYGT